MDFTLDGPAVTLDLTSLTDEQLAVLAADIAGEQYERALHGRDLPTITDAAFQRGFAGKRVSPPWLDGGLLVCPGQIVDKSKQSHDCTFVSVKPPGDTSRWVWESDSCVSDEIRKLAATHRHQQSITLVAAVEGLEVDAVVMQMRQGRHKLVGSTSFEVRSGELVRVATRSKPAVEGSTHR